MNKSFRPEDKISALDADGNPHDGWFVSYVDDGRCIVELDDNCFSEVCLPARLVIKR